VQAVTHQRGRGAHDFDHLDNLALKSDAEIESLASPELLALLDRIDELLTNLRPYPESRNLASRVRYLRELKHRGSRALGEAILEASAHLDRNEIEEAGEVYRRFLAASDSPFYRRIAERQLQSLPKPHSSA
jgi:hypothetical protein